MSSVDLVLWLPRSRASAPGTYQYRIWTTFEATVVALREDLEVVAIGYDLSLMQWQIAFLGSFLLLPPWAVDDGSGVHYLGKVNLNFLLSFVCTFVTDVIFCYQLVHLSTTVPLPWPGAPGTIATSTRLSGPQRIVPHHPAPHHTPCRTTPRICSTSAPPLRPAQSSLRSSYRCRSCSSSTPPFEFRCTTRSCSQETARRSCASCYAAAFLSSRARAPSGSASSGTR